MAEKLYKAGAEGEEGASADTEASSGSDDDDDVIDAEYTEEKGDS